MFYFLRKYLSTPDFLLMTYICLLSLFRTSKFALTFPLCTDCRPFSITSLLSDAQLFLLKVSTSSICSHIGSHTLHYSEFFLQHFHTNTFTAGCSAMFWLFPVFQCNRHSEFLTLVFILPFVKSTDINLVNCSQFSRHFSCFHYYKEHSKVFLVPVAPPTVHWFWGVGK